MVPRGALIGKMAEDRDRCGRRSGSTTTGARRNTTTGIWARVCSPRASAGLARGSGSLRTCLRALSMRSVLDVACGTGFLTQHLAGRVGGAGSECGDAADRARAGARRARAAGRCAAAALPRRRVRVPDGRHFYGHLDADARARSFWRRRGGWRSGSSWSTRPGGRMCSPKNAGTRAAGRFPAHRL
jgi:SAM-dependent methyltransferase